MARDEHRASERRNPTHVRVLGLALVLAGGACGDDDVRTLETESPAQVPRAEPDIDASLPSAARDGAAVDAGTDAAPAFAKRMVVEGLAAPWEVTFGPDARLWVTERTGKRVVRVDPRDGTRAVALRLDEVHQSSGQDGLLGMALHPRLLQGSGSDYVYLAYTYDADPGGALDRRVKIVRHRYDAAREQLVEGRELLRGLPASDDHNAGRLVYGPDDKLYYAIGDQGRNQFDHKCERNRAQDLPTADELARGDYGAYQGKILRIDVEGGIPADNPRLGGVRSHVFTYGHRNPQGLAFAPDGTLYASEHGPKTDDELNVIASGKNYGWPHVAGERDDRAYAYGDWSAARDPSCEALEYDEHTLPDGVPTTRERAWEHPDFMPPIVTFFTVDDGFDFRACGDRSTYLCWPTIAPSSLEVYSGGIPALGTSLLVPSLKEGSVAQVRLAADGRTVLDRGARLFETVNRYRDLTVAPDKQTFYIATDPSGETSGPTRGRAQTLENPGAILEFRLVSRGS